MKALFARRHTRVCYRLYELKSKHLSAALPCSLFGCAQALSEVREVKPDVEARRSLGLDSF